MNSHQINSSVAADYASVPAPSFSDRYAWLRIPAIAPVMFTLLCIMALGGMGFIISLMEAIANPVGGKAVFNKWLGILCGAAFVLLPVAGVIFRRRRMGWVLTAATVYILMSHSISDWFIEPIHFYPRPTGFIWSFVPLALMQTPFLKRFYHAAPRIGDQIGALLLGAFWGVLMTLAMWWALLF